MIQKKFHQAPFIRFILPLLLGIIFKLLLPNFIIPFFLVLCFYFLLILTPIFTTKFFLFKFNWHYGILLNTLFFLIGTSLVQQKTKTIENIPFSNKKTSFIGIIKEKPDEKDKTYQLVISINSYLDNNVWKECKNDINCFIPKDSVSNSFSIGDIVLFNSQIRLIPGPQNPKEFNYKKYMYYNDILCQAYIPSDNYTILEKESKYKLFFLANRIRDALLIKFNEYGIENDEYSVLSALTLGYKNELSSEIRNKYASSGAIHILAVSGLHVGIIYLIFNFLLSFLNKSRFNIIIKSSIIIVLLWAYALISGLSPSVIRASIMLSIVVAGKALERNSNIYNTITASAFLILILNPFAITQVSFQLSYLAVLGIVFLHEKFYKKIDIKYWLPDKIWMLVSISIAAQLATFPLTLYYFHQFPNYFFVTNIVIIPIATIIIYLSLTFLTFSFIPAVAAVVGIALSFTIKLLNKIISFVSELPFSHTENIYINLWETIFLFLLIISIISFFQLKKIIWLNVSLLIICVLISVNIIRDYALQDNDEIIVYNIKNESAINLIGKDHNILFADSSLYNNSEKMNFHLKNYWLNKGMPIPNIIDISNNIMDKDIDEILREYSCLDIENNIFLNYNKKRIGLINNNKLEKYSTQNPLVADYLIFTSSYLPDLNKLEKIIKCKNLIFDSSFSKWKINSLKEKISDSKISIYSTNTQGYIRL